MTDTQILTLAIAVVVPLGLLFLGNSRITDLRVTLQNSITEAKETLRAEANTHHIEQMGLLKSIMGKLDEMDARLTALEGKR